ncbi:methyl-accepting chemotaxis protein [Paenibacillus lentus]|uniref:Methyl-accepting chemotaxis protein n=1 Tax=Paenibacillus lentus TaxID=1338368 RepID=A0A3Q8S8S7_9BACL|nr:methyl-accepting chemotaxis protein [Paenibacillus lentus]AZK45026.1 methyl-accepting chemotaxis protein [Paenibacillus lentus]
MNLRKKLQLSFTIIIALFVIALSLSYFMNNRVSRLTDEIFFVNEKMKIIENINLFSKSANADAAQVLLAPAYLKENYKARFNADVSYVNKQIEVLQGLTTTEAEQKQIEAFLTEWQSFIQNQEELVKQYEGGEQVKAQHAFTQKSFDPVDFALLSYSIEQGNLALTKQEEIQSTIQLMNGLNLATATVVVIMSILISTLIANRLTRSIRAIQQHALEVAGGNLAVESLDESRKDELGSLAKSFNTMVVSLKKLISGADLVSGQVAAASAELQVSSEQISQATEHIAQVMQEIAHGSSTQVTEVAGNLEIMQSLEQNVRHIMEQSEVMTNTINISSTSTERGKQDLTDAIHQVEMIEQSTSSMAATIQGLNESTERIEQVVAVITDIATRTNLLALNAAIEAARAGEAGRGFGVVAEEIRKLALQSGQSTEEINHILSRIQAETSKTAKQMASSKDEVDKGIHLITIAGQSFESIEQSIYGITEVNTSIREITAKISAETQTATHQISAVSQIAQENAEGTQHISAASEQQMASMEEVAAFAESLANEAEELKNLIGQFKY